MDNTPGIYQVHKILNIFKCYTLVKNFSFPDYFVKGNVATLGENHDQINWSTNNTDFLSAMLYIPPFLVVNDEKIGEIFPHHLLIVSGY